jgi:hypothetical protein
MEHIGFGPGPVATVDDTELGFECCLYRQDGGGLPWVSRLGTIYRGGRLINVRQLIVTTSVNKITASVNTFCEAVNCDRLHKEKCSP